MVRPRAPLDPDEERLRKGGALPLFDSVEPASVGPVSPEAEEGVGSTPSSPRSTERDDSTHFPSDDHGPYRGRDGARREADGRAKRASGGGASTGAPSPTLRVDRHEPEASDGEAWKADAITQARHLVHVHGYVTPSMVRAAVGEPPEPMEAQYAMGGVFAKLRAMGLERTGEEKTSPVRTRNAARESVYRPGEKWGRA